MDAYRVSVCLLITTTGQLGKKFIQTEQNYKHGQMGLAYEIVINPDPLYRPLNGREYVTMQALVMAHACYGHNSFFKGNYPFQHGQMQFNHRLLAVC